MRARQHVRKRAGDCDRCVCAGASLARSSLARETPHSPPTIPITCSQRKPLHCTSRALHVLEVLHHAVELRARPVVLVPVRDLVVDLLLALGVSAARVLVRPEAAPLELEGDALPPAQITIMAPPTPKPLTTIADIGLALFGQWTRLLVFPLHCQVALSI